MASVKLVAQFSDGDVVVAKIKAPNPSPDLLDDMRRQAVQGLREACAELMAQQGVKAQED